MYGQRIIRLIEASASKIFFFKDRNLLDNLRDMVIGEDIGGGSVMDGIATVSYTHLDVYKRQVLRKQQ